MIDFITKLPKLIDLVTKIAYNSILVIIYCLIKQATFIVYKEVGILAKDFIYIFLRIVFVDYRILEEIILDRDSTFRSKF